MMILKRPSLFFGCFVLCLLALVTACEFPSGTEPAPTAVPTAAIPITPKATGQATNTPAPLPTRAPTPIPLPTPTYDPGRADWTILVYLDADNNLELSGLLDVNEMEAAGDSGQVYVLVQMDRAVGETDAGGDWTDARRYVIGGDADAGRIASEPAELLGEVNMGDPIVLADFLAWGIRKFPANRYALILWDHGAGWNGIAFDGDAPNFDGADHLSLADLDGALSRALSQTGLDKLDVVGFDACLMGQLDVFQAAQPYADYAVASEALTPGQGWDYEALLRHLYANPGMDGAQLARQMVTDFVAYYTYAEPDDFVTMAAVDLARLPDVTYKLELLAAALTADPAFVASAVGDARSGAEAYARVYADEFDQYAAVDLHHFASILAQRSPDEQVTAAAQEVMPAIETAVIANEHGAGFRHSQGIAIYFPRNAEFYAPYYASVTGTAAWDSFLTSYHAAGLAAASPPEVHITNVLSDVAGVQNPAYLDFEIVGRDIENVVLIGGRYEEDGRRRLLEYDDLIPEPTRLSDGSQLFEWRDGVHEDFYIWYTEVTYLYDAAGNGDYVVMWPTVYGSALFTVQGRYRRGTEETFFDANLVFDHRAGQLTRVWGFQSDESAAPAEVAPQPGDEFQVYSLYLAANGDVIREAGPRLFFDAERKLYFDWRPLPDGDYFLGFAAENVAGETADAFTDLAINNSDARPGYKAYLDPYLGFQFLYPESWYRPIYSDTLLYTSDLSGSAHLQITLYPNLAEGADAAGLKTQTLNLFGPVDVLFEDDFVVAGAYSLRTAYGYDRPDGSPRTGVFFTFVKDGAGYVVDVDGPQAGEAATIGAVATMAGSWTFLPAGFGLQPGEWAVLDLDAFSVAQPADFFYQPYNEWQRFIGGQHTFIALRAQPATHAAAEVLAALLRNAGNGVAGFTAGDPFRFPLGGSVWERVDFSYELDDGAPIWGFIMVKVEEGREVVAWAEAPAAVYNELEPGVFLIMIADMSLVE